ncbi:MAG: hypothetical protein WCK41_00145 [Actinomycetes bacterium]
MARAAVAVVTGAAVVVVAGAWVVVVIGRLVVVVVGAADVEVDDFGVVVVVVVITVVEVDVVVVVVVLLPSFFATNTNATPPANTSMKSTMTAMPSGDFQIEGVVATASLVATAGPGGMSVTA